MTEGEATHQSWNRWLTHHEDYKQESAWTESEYFILRRPPASWGGKCPNVYEEPNEVYIFTQEDLKILEAWT